MIDLSASECTVCFTGSDSAIAFKGSLEYCAAGLVALGIPTNEAIATVQTFPPPFDDEGTATLIVRVCERCCAEHGLAKPGLAYIGAKIPTYCQNGVPA